MAWYGCKCGFIPEMTPQFGDAIVSVSHLHRGAPGGSAGSIVSVVRMEEIADPVPQGEGSRMVERRDTHRALAEAGAGSLTAAGG